MSQSEFGAEAGNIITDGTESQGNWIQCFDEETGFPYVYNDLTGETKWVDASTANDILITLWQKFYDDNGDAFYYNPHTGESTWELPANAVVEESVEHDQGNAGAFADQDDIEYDGAKYIEAYNSGSLDIGGEPTFGGSRSLEHDESQEQLPSARHLNQSSLHSARSTKSASYIPMKLLVKKSSKEGMVEKKTSFGSLSGLEKKHSAQSLGIKSGASFVINRAPVVRDSLKPMTPNQSSKSSKLTGFAALKVGATIVRKQVDENGRTWIEYQAANNGPIFYSQVDGLSEGQWNRPPVFDLEDLSSTSIVSVEPVDLHSLDEALLSRSSSRKDVTGGSAANSFQSRGSVGSEKQSATVPPSVGAPVTASTATKTLRRTAEPATTTSATAATTAGEDSSSWDRKPLFGSFINSVFVETVAKEDQLQTKPEGSGDMALEALFGTDDSAKETSAKVEIGVPYSPDYNPIIAAHSPGAASQLQADSNDTPLESPAERIALTPKSKLPPGSGMRKASFSQLDYIPETQPLFDASEASHSARDRLDSADLSNHAASPTIGEGMAAARALYLNAHSSSPASAAPATSTVPFHSGGKYSGASVDAGSVSSAQSLAVLPRADLFGSREGESAATPSATDAPAPLAAAEGADNEGSWIQCYDEESGWPYVYNAATGEMKWVEPESTEQLLADLWDVYYDEDGNVFYYNPASGVSSWELPDNAKLSSSAAAAAAAEQTETMATADPAAETVVQNSGLTDTPLSPSLVSMKGLTKKASLQTLVEKSTSVGNLTPLAKKESAKNLGIKTGSAWIKSKPPEVKADLKPTLGSPKPGASQLTGFALLKVGAKVLDKQIDEEGDTWIKYQAVDNGPIFYSKEGSHVAGQWHKPPIYHDDGEDDVVAVPGSQSSKPAGARSAGGSVMAGSSEKSAAPVPLSGSLLNILAGVTGKSPAPLQHQPAAVPALVAAPTAVAAVIPKTDVAAVPVPAPIGESPKVVDGQKSVTSIPPLALAPIVAAQGPPPAHLASPDPRHDSEDPALYELSGVTLDSQQNKESLDLDNIGKEFSASRLSLLQELRDMGLDEDGNMLASPRQSSSPERLASNKGKVSSSPAQKTSPQQTKQVSPSKTADRKLANVDAKLREIDTVSLTTKLVESPYKAKSTEKYPVKVSNPLSTSQLAKPKNQTTSDDGQESQRPSSSPAKRSAAAAGNAHSAAGADTRPRSSPGKRSCASPHQSTTSPELGRKTGDALASEADFAQSAFRAQLSGSLGGLGSSHIGGAVRSSFLTDLGLSTAESPGADDAYRPPRGVHPEVLIAERTRGTRLDATLRQLAGGDANDDEATLLLHRLQRLAEGGAGTVGAAQRTSYDEERDVHSQSRKIIERTCLLLERIEPSRTEHRVAEIQLLEVMLEQRSFLTPPRSLVRDYKAHNSLPVHCCSPQTARHPQVEHKLETVADAGAWLVCRDPFFLHGRYFYVNKTTHNIQVGDPFDFRMKKNRKDIHKENWYDYELNLTVNQHHLENVNAELLRDSHAGLLVYSATEDQYSSTGRFDTNWAARARFSPGMATGTGVGTFHATSTTNLRASALLNRADPLRYSHQRPASATAAGGLLRVHSGAVALANTVQGRKSAPRNVWATLDLSRAEEGEGEGSVPYTQQTLSFRTATDFGELDRMATSFGGGGGEGAGGGEVLDHFATLQNGFSSAQGDDALLATSGGFQDFSSPYHETEMLLEMTRHRKQVEPNGMLAFEEAMSATAYLQYSAHVAAIAAEPEDPLPLLELMEWLVYQGLGKQAMATLKRALAVMELQSEWSLTGHEMAACRILYAKLASKYFMKYEKPTVFYALVDSFPESPFVLSHAALYFMEMKYHDQAELLFLAALMLQPNYERALLGYARLLAEKGNPRVALRYLGRISEDSPLWLPAKLEMAGIQELQRVDTPALLVAYKNCTLLTAVAEDTAYATALHCSAYHHHRLHEIDKETFHLTCALSRHPDSPQALLMTAAFGAARLVMREHSITVSTQSSSGATSQERPRTASGNGPAADGTNSTLGAAPVFTKDELDAKFRSGVLLAPRRWYRWIAALGYADFVDCVMRDTHRAEQYYAEASKISFSYSVWATLALAHFYQYTRGEAGAAGRLLLRVLRHRHADVAIDCLTAFNAFRHREVNTDPTSELLKYMSLPSADAHLATPLEETQDDLEIAALYVVIAFYLMDLQEWEDAMKYAAAAIRINETFSPALRCIALITWQHGNTRKASLRYFEAALEFGAGNPYVLRTCAVVKAMEGHHEEAIGLLQSSVKISPNCPLTMRAVGMMCYLYRKDADAALDYLAKSFAMSNSEDIECLRLRGQVLMDLGRYKEARAAFQQALYIVPWDAVTLASLAYCVSVLYRKDAARQAENTFNGTFNGGTLSVGGSSELNYSSRLMAMRSPEELIHSRDPVELFEASVTMDLQRIFAGHAHLSPTGSEQYAKVKSKRAVNPFGQSNGMVLSNFAVENELEEADADFGNNMTGYAYYWYGMYELKRATHFNADKCRTLFSLAAKVAAPGSSSSCNALALYRLGELAEREGNLEAAERHYVSAVQCEPMDPQAVLRLVCLVEAGLAGVKKIIRMLEVPRRRKGGKKGHKPKNAHQLDGSGTLSTYHPPARGNIHDSSLVHNLTALLSRPLNPLPEEDADEDTPLDGSADNGLAQQGDALQEYQRRLLLHQRVHEMVTLKRRAYRKTLSEAAPANPSHHMFVDSYWLERLLHAFSRCEDWARLHQCASQVQMRPKKKATTAGKKRK